MKALVFRHSLAREAASVTRHNSYRVKRPGDHGIRHDGPPAIELVNLRSLSLVA